MLSELICKKYFQEFKIGKFKLRVHSQYEVVNVVLVYTLELLYTLVLSTHTFTVLNHDSIGIGIASMPSTSSTTSHTKGTQQRARCQF